MSIIERRLIGTVAVASSALGCGAAIDDGEHEGADEGQASTVQEEIINGATLGAEYSGVVRAVKLAQ